MNIGFGSLMVLTQNFYCWTILSKLHQFHSSAKKEKRKKRNNPPRLTIQQKQISHLNVLFPFSAGRINIIFSQPQVIRQKRKVIAKKRIAVLILLLTLTDEMKKQNSYQDTFIKFSQMPSIRLE